jgi:hypothetical protein
VGDLPGLAVGHVLGDVALLASVGVIDPRLGQVESAVQGCVPPGRGIGQEDADLAVLLLAQPSAPLAGHAAAVLALLGKGGGVQDDDPAGLAPFLGDIPPHLGGDRLVVPGPLADEHLEVLAGDGGLGGDRLDGLPLQAAEQAPDEGRGMATLLLAREQGEVAFQESRDVVTATTDIVGGNLGVVEQGLGLGVIKQRHGGTSGGVTPRDSS